MSCLKEGLYCSKLSCRVTIRGWVSQDFTSGRSKCLRGERLGKKWTLSNTLSKGCPQHGGGQFTAGLLTNSILSCLRFATRDHCKNVLFLQSVKMLGKQTLENGIRLRRNLWQSTADRSFWYNPVNVPQFSPRAYSVALGFYDEPTTPTPNQLILIELEISPSV